MVIWVRPFTFFRASGFYDILTVLYPNRFLEGEDSANNFLFNADRFINYVYCFVKILLTVSPSKAPAITHLQLRRRFALYPVRS